MHPRAPVIALDGDSAGQQAAAALAARIAKRGRESAIVSWPKGEEPASWLAAQGAVVHVQAAPTTPRRKPQWC
jgi:DNA primase